VTAALASPDVLRRHGGLRRLTGGLPVTLAVVLAATGAFVALLFIAGFHSVLVSGQHDVDALQKRLTAGRGETQILRMKVAQLESPQRIQDLALGRLGMKTPHKVLYLNSVVLGDPTNPVPPPGNDPFGSARP
jgi:cell division protein FtsL